MAKKRHQAGRGSNIKSKKVLKSEVKDGVRITELKVNPKSKIKRKKQFVGRKVIDPKLLMKYTKGEGIEVGHERSLDIVSWLILFCPYSK